MQNDKILEKLGWEFDRVDNVSVMGTQTSYYYWFAPGETGSIQAPDFQHDLNLVWRWLWPPLKNIFKEKDQKQLLLNAWNSKNPGAYLCEAFLDPQSVNLNKKKSRNLSFLDV